MDPRLAMVTDPSKRIQSAHTQHMAREVLVSQLWEIQEAVGLVAHLVRQEKKQQKRPGSSKNESPKAGTGEEISYSLPRNRKELLLFIESEVSRCVFGASLPPSENLRKLIARLIKPPKRQRPREVSQSVLQKSIGAGQETADFVKMDIFQQQTAWGNGLGLEKHLFKQKGVKFTSGALFLDFLQIPGGGGGEEHEGDPAGPVPIFLQVPYRVDGKYWKQEQNRLPSVGSEAEVLQLPPAPKKIYVMCRTSERSDQLELRELCSSFSGAQDMFYVKNPEALQPETTLELVGKDLICERTKMYPVLSAPKMHPSCTFAVKKLESFSRDAEGAFNTGSWRYTPNYIQENHKLRNFADGMYSLLFFLAFFDVFGPALNEEKRAGKGESRMLEVALFFIGDVTVEARVSNSAFKTGNKKRRKKKEGTHKKKNKKGGSAAGREQKKADRTSGRADATKTKPRKRI